MSIPPEQLAKGYSVSIFAATHRITYAPSDGRASESYEVMLVPDRTMRTRFMVCRSDDSTPWIYDDPVGCETDAQAWLQLQWDKAGNPPGTVAMEKLVGISAR
jgi:hypothetical protein